MDTITIVLTATDQFMLALYVASVLTVTWMNLAVMFHGASYGIGTVWFTTFLNIVTPIAVAISTGMWWFGVLGLGYFVMLIYILVQTIKMAIKDANNED